jgi:GxxExxY protein
MDIVKEICFEVGCLLGKGYSENVYQEGIAVLLREMCIVYSKEVTLPIKFKELSIGTVRADIVLPNDKIIIECKAVDNDLKLNCLPQLVNYLKITGYPSGLFVNFNQNPLRTMVEIITLQQTSFNDSLYKVEREGKDDIFIDKNGIIVDHKKK